MPAADAPVRERVAAAIEPRAPGPARRRSEPPEQPAFDAAGALLARAVGQIDAWFARADRTLDMPLDMPATDWQRRVWTAAAALRFGECVTYGELAARMGTPRAARAVGMALGANPCLLFTPCHRVVGRGGRLVGYAAGVERKRWLLAFESGVPARGSG